MSGGRVSGWQVVVPVKGGGAAKSRLRTPPGADRAALARAIAIDTVTAAAAVVGARQVWVVTRSAALAPILRALEVRLIPDPGLGLDAAVLAGAQAAGRTGSDAVAALLGDLPALRPADLGEALRVAAAYPRAFVPDHAGTGTVLLTATRGEALRAAFGPGSAARHEAAGHRRLDLDLPSLRLDVDDSESLDAASRLGLGAATSQVLDGRPARPATVQRHDARGGTVRLDDGTEVGYAANAVAPGLRHLRPGQRVSVRLGDDGPRRSVVGLWLPAEDPGRPAGPDPA